MLITFRSVAHRWIFAASLVVGLGVSAPVLAAPPSHSPASSVAKSGASHAQVAAKPAAVAAPAPVATEAPRTPAPQATAAIADTSVATTTAIETPAPSLASRIFGIAIMIVGLVVGLAAVIMWLRAFWKIFAKAGEPGWASLIPVYNQVLLLKIVGKPWWYLFVPVMNVIAIAFMVPFGLAKKFGRGTGFGFGLLFLPVIFYPILGLGSARYDATA
jgi:hypothetical protein